MVNRYIDLKRLWIFSNNPRVADIKSKGIDIVYTLRFLLLCDQCHDFLENEERNNWINSATEDIPKQKQSIFNLLINSYKDDYGWLTSELPLPSEQLKPYINIDEAKEAILKGGTKGIVTHIDKMLEENFNIHTMNLGKGNFTYLKKPCSKAADYLFRVLNSDATQEEMDSNEYVIAVDADKSKFNNGSLLLYLCDNLHSPDSNLRITLVNNVSGKYDSSSGSGTYSYLKQLEHNLKNSKLQGSSDSRLQITEPEPCEIILTYGDLVIMKFEYGNINVVSRDENRLDFLYAKLRKDQLCSPYRMGKDYSYQPTPIPTNTSIAILNDNLFQDIRDDVDTLLKSKIITIHLLDKLYKPIKNIIGSFRIDPQRKKYHIPVILRSNPNLTYAESDKPAVMKDLIQWSNIKDKSIPGSIPGSTIKFKHIQIKWIYLKFIFYLFQMQQEGGGRGSYLNQIHEAITNRDKDRSEVMQLNIKKFFKKDEAEFGNYNCNINSTNTSLDNINSKNSSVDKLTTNYTIENEEDLPYIVCYKTLGDFGQILEFTNEYVQVTRGLTKKNIFLTIDLVCSRIASLFIPKTFFEDQSPQYVGSPVSSFSIGRPQNIINKLLGRSGGVPQTQGTVPQTQGTVPQLLGPSGVNQFSSYNKFGYVTKNKYNNKKYSDTKIEYINNQVKKMGLKKIVKNFSIDKKNTYINKLKKFAKRYKLVEDKNLLINLKLLYKLQEKAKKLKINITKMKNGNRIYLTINELKKKLF